MGFNRFHFYIKIVLTLVLAQVFGVASVLGVSETAATSNSSDRVRFSTQDKADRYGLEFEALRRWDDLMWESETDPPKYIKIIEKRLSQLTSQYSAERLYGELVLIGILLKLEKAPEGLERIEKVWPDALALPYPMFKARLYEEKAKVYNSLGKYQQAYDNIRSALRGFKDLEAPTDYSRARMIRGLILVNQDRFEEALQDYLFAYKQFKAVNDKISLSAVVASIAQVYSQTGQHDDAIQYYKESLDLIDQANHKLQASIILFNIGTASDRAGKFEQAEEYLKKALAISQEIEDKVGIAYAWHELADLRASRKDYEGALVFFEKAHAIILESQDRRMQVNIEEAMGETLAHLGRFDLAHQYLDNALQLSKKLDIKPGVYNSYRTKAFAYELAEDYKSAYKYFKLATVTRAEEDKLKNEKSINELKVTFDTAAKEAQNQLLMKENAVNKLALEKQKAEKRMLWAFVSLCLLIVLMIVFILWRQIQVRKRFTALALTDELTKAPNRRNIVEFAQYQLELAKAAQSSLVLALVDLDKFKSINDNFGHDVGDKVLQQFYALGCHALRNGDRLGRFGGEEWLLIMPGLMLEQVNDVFERLRSAVNSQRIEGLPADNPVTFSMGVIAYQSGLNLNAMLKLADAALYRAKLQGRNQWQLGKPESKKDSMSEAP